MHSVNASTQDPGLTDIDGTPIGRLFVICGPSVLRDVSWDAFGTFAFTKLTNILISSPLPMPLAVFVLAARVPSFTPVSVFVHSAYEPSFTPVSVFVLSACEPSFTPVSVFVHSARVPSQAAVSWFYAMIFMIRVKKTLKLKPPGCGSGSWV
jgi:hypothetical protein